MMLRGIAAALLAAMVCATPAAADDDDGRQGRWSHHWEGDEGEIKYRDGDCKVEREWKKGGEYKEKVECDGPASRRYRHDREIKYRDGDCKVEREWKKDGEYKEKVECDGPSWRRGYRVPPVAIYQDREWVNPDGSLPAPPQGPEYGRVYRGEDGRYCREYQTTGRIDGRSERLYGAACLGPDGQWAFND